MEVNVFPNPFSEVLSFSFKMENRQEVNITLYDLAGRVVYERQSILDKGNQSVTWNVPGEFGNGHYIYRITTGNLDLTGKVVLHR
jgi:hypothetical protein